MDQPSAPTVAAFDLDGTLTEGGSVFPWLRHIAGSSDTYTQALRLAGPLTLGALRSGPTADNAKERLFRALLAGRDEKHVRDVSASFELDHLATKGRQHVLARLRWHLDQGHDVVIISASPQLYVDVVADALGVQGALGTRLAVDAQGKLTGQYSGKNCRGSEKLRRLDEWVEARHFPTKPITFAYGNSRGDLNLLASATYPVNVGRLGRLGSLREFPQLTNAS
jgi:phosphatidylglycerophosphatase C